jgi:hypothetical protein
LIFLPFPLGWVHSCGEGLSLSLVRRPGVCACSFSASYRGWLGYGGCLSLEIYVPSFPLFSIISGNACKLGIRGLAIE